MKKSVFIMHPSQDRIDDIWQSISPEKFIVAMSLSREASLIMCDQITEGFDVAIIHGNYGSKEERSTDLVERLAAYEGCYIIVISSQEQMFTEVGASEVCTTMDEAIQAALAALEE